MRQFSSPRVSGLEFTMYEDGSGGAEYKGKKIGSVDLQTKEIKIEGDTWTPYPYESRILDMFMEQAEDYAIKNLNAEKHFCAEIDNIYVQPVAEGDPYLQIYLKNIREDDVFEYIERSDLLSQTSFSKIYELMYSTQNFNSGLGAEAPTLSISITVNINDDPKMEIVFEDGEGYPYAEVPLTEKEKAEINTFIVDKLGCSGSEYIQSHNKVEEAGLDREIRKVDYDEAIAVYREANGLDDYDDVSDEPDYSDEYIAQEAELAREIRQVDYDEAAAVYREANGLDDYDNVSDEPDYSDEYIAQVLAELDRDMQQVSNDEAITSNGYNEITDNKKHYEDMLLKAGNGVKLDRAAAAELLLTADIVRRRNKEDLEDKDGDHIPDRIDSSYSSEGYRTQNDVDRNATLYDEYRKALVTSDEYEELQAKGFECQKAKTVHYDGRIPIRFKASDKENFEKIIHSFGGKHEGIHI